MSTRRRFPTHAHWLDWLAGRTVPYPPPVPARPASSMVRPFSGRAKYEVVTGTDDYYFGDLDDISRASAIRALRARRRSGPGNAA